MPVEKQDVTILIVDDSSSFRRIHVAGLTANGISHTVEFSSLAALESFLAKNEIEARITYGAITDGLGGDAIGVVSEISKITPQDNIWIVSGSQDIVNRAKSHFPGIHTSNKQGLTAKHPLYSKIVESLVADK